MKYWHDFSCGHTNRTNCTATWKWMKEQKLCSDCRKAADAKPPIGLRPASIWLAEIKRQRAVEITQAMQRYAEDGKSIPCEWWVELRTHLKSLES